MWSVCACLYIILSVWRAVCVFAQRYQEKGSDHCVTCSVCLLIRGTRRRVLLTVCVFAQRYQEKGSDHCV